MNDKDEFQFENARDLFDFIPYFESDDKKYDIAEKISLDPYLYHEPARQFVKMLYEKHIIMPFDWRQWSEEANRYFNSPECIDTADIAAIRKLLTTIVRADRFSAGFFADKMDNGTVLRLLKRLQVLVDQSSNGVLP
ncbi:DUF6508 domain-containing protein [Brevibacillus sp. B_LB10_24]|uniref:DUF6508 domain-containing protein n=1 Tax=Brevibacillus sp. B_LB10_24 TaxID=3380645 RepID=UPI0038BA7DF9